MDSSSLSDFNLLVACIRNREHSATIEVEDLIGSVVGDRAVEVEFSGIRSLLIARTSLEPRKVVEKLKMVALDDPWRFQYTLKYIPVDIVAPTKLELIVEASRNVIPRILEHETFRITCNRRHSQLHCVEIIKSVAALIDRKVDLENPMKVLQIEILGERTGLAVLGEGDILSLYKL